MLLSSEKKKISERRYYSKYKGNIFHLAEKETKYDNLVPRKPKRVSTNINRARGSTQYKLFLKFELFIPNVTLSQSLGNSTAFSLFGSQERVSSLQMFLRAPDNYISVKRESGDRSLCVLLCEGWQDAPAKNLATWSCFSPNLSSFSWDVMEQVQDFYRNWTSAESLR